MYHLVILAALSAPPNADAAVAAAWGFNERMSRVETEIVQLRNDVAAIKRDISAKCDVASKSPEPKPAAKCPDGICADCKCKLGEDCGCRKTLSEQAIADVLTPKSYREIRTCNGNGQCTVQMMPVDATDETPQVILQERSGYSAPCASGNCGVQQRQGFRPFKGFFRKGR